MLRFQDASWSDESNSRIATLLMSHNDGPQISNIPVKVTIFASFCDSGANIFSLQNRTQKSYGFYFWYKKWLSD